MLLIGSKALNNLLDNPLRAPRDTDYICTQEQFDHYLATHTNIIENRKIKNGVYACFHEDGSIMEFNIASTGTTNMELLEKFNANSIDSPITSADLNTLLMLKMSHRYLRNSPHFPKTMSDIKKLRAMGAVLNKELKIMLKKREAETYTYNHPKLNRSKGEFFDASVKYKYQHDDIHQVIKVLDKPAYEFFKPDEKEVLTSMKMFAALPEEIKLYAVLEESLVLAAERSQLAFDNPPHPSRSFMMALTKVCTSITSGKFREYAWENFDKVVDMYKAIGYDYMVKINAAIADGRIREFTKPSM